LETNYETLARKTRPLAGSAAAPKTYRELCQPCLPRPIHDHNEDDAATETMNALSGASWCGC
jgi:hypothetical protein